MGEFSSDTAAPGFGPAELGALAHLYRGEVYRSTVWRTRLRHAFMRLTMRVR